MKSYRNRVHNVDVCRRLSFDDSDSENGMPPVTPLTPEEMSEARGKDIGTDEWDDMWETNMDLSADHIAAEITPRRSTARRTRKAPGAPKKPRYAPSS